MTYGQLKLRLTQAFPGVSLDLIEGWCNDRYQEILFQIPWQRQNVQAILETAAPYSTGTAAVTEGSTAVTLTGGAWTAAMSAMAFRVPGGDTTDPNEDGGADPFYAFTFADATHGTLDRPYEGVTAAAAGYSIFQSVYLLPSDCRLLENDAFGAMQRFTHGQLDLSDPYRIATGRPVAWASYMDDDSTPPNMQVELWPIPDQAIGIPFTYQAAAADLTSTAAILQIWILPAALVEGITAQIKAHLKDYTGAAFHAAVAERALKTMRGAEAQGLAPAQMRLDPYFTSHRRKRWQR